MKDHDLIAEAGKAENSLARDAEQKGIPISDKTQDLFESTQKEYHALLHHMDSLEATVLEAELNSGAFRLIYNSNPDYSVKMPEAGFEKFAQFFGGNQIHPDDREHYLQEIQFCHGPFFDQGLHRHSVYSRMFRPSTGAYHLYEFVTLRVNPEDMSQRKVILICRPVKDERPDADAYAAKLLEATVLQAHTEERLKENGQIFDIVSQHSNRILYLYAPMSRSIRPWDAECVYADVLSHLESGIRLEEACGENSDILPESVEATRKFFADIHSGVPCGEANIRIRLKDGRPRWFHLKYSSIFNAGVPVTVLISTEDITERHEHQMAFLRNEQAVKANAENYLLYVESCLTTDRVEKLSGQIFVDGELQLPCSHHALDQILMQRKFKPEDMQENVSFSDYRELAALYEQGERHIKRNFKARFYDESLHWLGVEISLLADPFNGHIKAFTSLRDITRETEESLSVRQRADYDAMTGLLRRDVGEARIRTYLSAHNYPGGVLIVLDLDDLKRINDALGHSYGDRAIIGIADRLKIHFPDDAILVRAGGDEFMVFLPQAARNLQAMEQSLLTLLKNVSELKVGDNHECAIRCSAGCAVELSNTDTFDSLYQRADMALYHVKRSGKNGFTFFEPAMLEDSYRMRIRQARPVLVDVSAEIELHQLLELIAMQYPGVVLFNLTRDHFHILAVGSNVETVHPPDKMEVFWENWRENIHPEDRELTISAMSRSSLLACYAQGQRRIMHYFRNKEAAGYLRTELDVRFYRPASGDVCALLLFRWDHAMQE